MDRLRYELVALDVDGTILDNAGRLSPRLKAMAPRLAAAGVRIVLCTGRRYRTALQILTELVHAHPVAVCVGGALVKEAERHRTIQVTPLDPDVSRRAVELFRAAGLVPFLLVDRPLEQRELLISEMDQAQAEGLPYVVANRPYVEYYAGEYPTVQEPVLDVYTLDHVSRIRAHVAGIRESLAGQAIVTPLTHQPTGPDELALETHAPTVSKWNALRRLLADWGVGSARVVAVGNDLNDIPMLRGAGLSFAVANASAEVKAAAQRVTASNDEEGVAEALGEVFRGLL